MTSSSFRQYPSAVVQTPEEVQAELDNLRSADQFMEQNEEEKKKRDAGAKERQAKEKTQQDQNKKKLKEPTGAGAVVQELGTAVVGAGIDAVEGVAGNAQQLVTGQINNPNFKPTWLQVPDDQEPINKTWWGNLIRGVGEFGLLSAGVRGAANKAGGPAARLLGGSGVRAELARGALVGNLSSQSQGDNLSRVLADAFPWMPDALATNDADSPLMKRAKNTLEGLGLDFVFDAVAGFLKGRRAAQQATEAQLVESQARIQTKIEQDAARQTRIQEAKQTYEGLRDQYNVAQAAALGKPKDDPAVAEAKRLRDQMREAGVRYRAEKSATNLETATPASPEPVRDNSDISARVSAAEVEANRKAREANFDELANSRLADDPEGLKGPDPYVNSPLYDPNERPIFSVKKDGLEKALLDAFKINTDPRYFRGRPESLATEAALEKRLAGDFKERRRAIENLAKQITKTPEFIGEYDGIRVTKKEYQNLAIARLLDTLDEFNNPEDLDGLKAKLMAQPAMQTVGGRNVSYMNRENVAAAELLLNVTAGEMADLATAARSVQGVLDTTTQENMILKRMEFLLKETYFAKYMGGSTLNSHKWGGLELLSPNKADAEEVARQIDSQVETTINSIRELRDQGDDTLMKLYMDAISISDGKIKTLVDLDRYMKDRIHKWDGNPDEQGGIIKGAASTFINGALSGPKTTLRAWLGTSTAVALRPLTLYIGGLKRGDARLQAKALHQMAVWQEGANEALQMFSKSLNSWVSGDGNLYDNFAGNTDALHNTEQWKVLGEWVQERGDLGNKVGYSLATMLSRMNNSPFISYPMGLMGAGDAANRTIIGRMELKALAFDKAWDANKGVVDAQLIRKYEEELHSSIFNKDGVVTDKAASLAGDEAALTTNLGPQFQGLENLINYNPLLKPFFMFPKTGINALKYVMSYNPLGTGLGKVPILNRFLTEVNEILNVTPETMEAVMTKYGIRDIEAAKAMYEGRIAFGQTITFSAIGLYLSGNLTGNGPYDKETRNAWFQTNEWKPRSIKIGNQWVGYDSLDPFSSLLALVADIGDNSDQLGALTIETWLQRISYCVAMNLTNKTFLTGIQPLAEILSTGGSNSQLQAKVPAMLANGLLLPYSSLRKELAEGFNPGMRELEDNFWDLVRNRNPGLKGQLPYKRDVLNGEPLKLYDPMTRMYNLLSPFQINPVQNETRELLRRSGFDIVTTLKTDSKSNALNPEQRSRMQNEMGKENIEGQLAELFKTQKYTDSFLLAQEVRDRGIPSDQWPIRAHYHTQAIKAIFDQAKRNAEARIRLVDGETQAVRSAQALSVAKEAAKSGDTETARNYLDLLQMYK